MNSESTSRWAPVRTWRVVLWAGRRDPRCGTGAQLYFVMWIENAELMER